MSDLLTDLLSRYGYSLVAIFLFVETIGVPIPGETALVTAAAFAGRGTMSIVGVIVAAFVGTVGGSATGYWLGLRGGPAIIDRFGRILRLDAPRLERAHAFFVRHGAKTVLLGRFVAFVRSFIGIFAGISRMPVRRFLLFNALGGILWTLTFSACGYFFGRNLPRLIDDLGRVSLVFAILVALVVGAVFAWRWFGRNRGAIVAAIDQRWRRLAESPRIGPLRASHPRLWQAMAARYAQTEYLAMHLIIGFLLSLTVIGIFGVITEDIVEGSPLTRFDLAVATRLHESVGAAVLGLLRTMSAFGSRPIMTLLLLLGGVLFAAARRPLDLIAWCAAFVGGSLLDAALRFVVHRSALPFADVVVAEWGTGLASAHVLGAVVGLGMLAHFLFAQTAKRGTRAAIVVTTVAIVVGIAVSRLYLGIHYVSDEMAGLAAGVLWLTTCVSGLEIAEQRSREARIAAFSARRAARMAPTDEA
jgi:membrane protein DedA with SNARE-associated domain/membrane-associated phospholipid phosphatase